MGELRNAFDKKKHDAVKELKHKEKSIYVSTDDIFEAKPKYGNDDHWGYIRDQFREKHGVEITDTEKLVLYTTLLDNTMKISGHVGFSLGEPKA